MSAEALAEPVPDFISPAQSKAAEIATQNVVERAGIPEQTGFRHTTYEEHQAMADAAFDMAVEHKEEHGLDPETVAYYDLAATHIRGLVWTGPTRPLDTMHMIKLGGSLANLAEATGTPARSERYGGEKAHLEELARRELRYAGELLMGAGHAGEEALVGTMVSAADQKTNVMAAKTEEVVEQLTEEHALSEIAY